jgi:amino acid transporter
MVKQDVNAFATPAFGAAQAEDEYLEVNTHGSRTVIDPDSGVKRGLKNRHLSMMALAGIIGPGLLVGSGGALSSGGPASLLIGFGVIGIIAFSIMQSLGEITTLYPAGGSFVGLAERVVDKGFSAAVGWVSLHAVFKRHNSG